MSCVSNIVSNIQEALVLLSEFTNEYSIQEDANIIEAYIDRKHLREVSRKLDRKGFELIFYETYGHHAQCPFILVHFCQKKRHE